MGYIVILPHGQPSAYKKSVGRYLCIKNEGWLLGLLCICVYVYIPNYRLTLSGEGKIVRLQTGSSITANRKRCNDPCSYGIERCFWQYRVIIVCEHTNHYLCCQGFPNMRSAKWPTVWQRFNITNNWNYRIAFIIPGGLFI